MKNVVLKSRLQKVRRERMGHIELGSSCCTHLVLEIIAITYRFDDGYDIERYRKGSLL